MSKAIGMVEYKTVSTGIQAADLMLKTADVEIIEAQTVCPGKYIVIISGDLSAVTASVEASKTQYGQQLIDYFVLGNQTDLFCYLWSSKSRKCKSVRSIRNIFCRFYYRSSRCGSENFYGGFD